jgi:hypothetical protein
MCDAGVLGLTCGADAGSSNTSSLSASSLASVDQVTVDFDIKAAGALLDQEMRQAVVGTASTALGESAPGVPDWQARVGIQASWVNWLQECWAIEPEVTCNPHSMHVAM